MTLARDAATDTSPVQAVPLAVRILGPVTVTWAAAADGPVEITSALSPRLRELFVVIALHPEGISRDRIADTLWPDAPPTRPHNNLTTGLSRLRSALNRATDTRLPDPIIATGDRLQLDPAVVLVDYHTFTEAVAFRRQAEDDAGRAAAWRQMIEAYQGELADGMSADWLETQREAIRRDAIDAASRLARSVAAADPQQALDLLELARTLDPYNEQLYRDIMRLQRRLGVMTTDVGDGVAG
jgi:DNA-binding SARP family transcriptional activator